MSLKAFSVVLCATIASAADPALTIYNQGFAVIREIIPVEWKSGTSEVRYSGVTAHVEPDSVILRDPKGTNAFQILEQNYRNDPVSQQLLLSLFEGQTIPFQQGDKTVQGKIIRSGYTLRYQPLNRYSQQYYQTQMATANASTPVVEVDGRLIFQLPGQPMFPSLPQDTILKPTLTWLVKAASAGKTQAELSYVSGGMSWNADYNVVANEKDQKVDVLGWVTMDNQTGSSFSNARMQLMAGDVSKVQQPRQEMMMARAGGVVGGIPGAPPVSERAFDEYHLYTLDNRVTLRDRETKQVEFLRAASASSQQIYVYDGAAIDRNRYAGWGYEQIRNDPSYGTQSNPKVWVMREIENTKANHLGMALPAGRVRFYKSDNEGRLQFTGENNIQHTPQGEKIRLYTGNAFDIVGERSQKEFQNDPRRRWSDETFEIKVRNRKEANAEVRVVEHLYRGTNWSIQQPSDTFTKTDSTTIEFRITLKPNEERTITYKVHYTF